MISCFELCFSSSFLPFTFSGRGVCVDCSASHRLIPIPCDRVLTYTCGPRSPAEIAATPLPPAPANLPNLAMFSYFYSEIQACLLKSHSSVSFIFLTSFVLAFNMHSCMIFVFYLSQGVARSFELFDAADLSLWEEALPFSHIYVFVSAEHAVAALRANPAVP